MDCNQSVKRRVQISKSHLNVTIQDTYDQKYLQVQNSLCISLRIENSHLKANLFRQSTFCVSAMIYCNIYHKNYFLFLLFIQVGYSPFLHYLLVPSSPKINIGNTGNQNHPDLKVRVVLVTCFCNINFF